MANTLVKKGQSTTSFAVKVVVMLVLMFGFRFLPQIPGISEMGMQVVGVFLGTVFGWLTLGLAMPSVFSMVALAMTDYTNINGVMKNGFGNSTVGLIIILFLIAAFIENVGLNGKIVNFMLSRKSLRGRPYLFMTFYFLAITLVNVVSQKWLSVLFFVEFVREMCNRTDLEPRSKEASVLMHETVLVGMVSSLILPIKDQAISRMGVFTAATGVDWSPLRYTAVGLPLTLILIFSVLLTNKFILRVDFSCLANAPLVDANEAKLNQDQKTAVKFVIALCVAMIIPGFVSKSFPVFGVLGSTGCAFLVLAIMLVVRRNGQPLVKMKDIAKHVNWDVLLLLAAMFPMVNALGDEEVGITAIIESSLGGLTGLSPFLFLFIIVIATGILTQFMNNAIASSLVVTGLCMMGSVLPKGVSLEGLTLLIAFSTNLACWLPSATAANAYGYGQTDVVEFKHYFRSGLTHLIVMLILVGVVGVGLVSVVYRGML